MLKYVDGNDFEKEVLNSSKVVLVDFYATWCGPCSILAPILEKVAEKRDEFDIVKIDIDENKELAYQYEIMVVPTMVIFKDGQVVNEIEGVLSEEEILSSIEKYI